MHRVHGIYMYAGLSPFLYITCRRRSVVRQCFRRGGGNACVYCFYFKHVLQLQATPCCFSHLPPPSVRAFFLLFLLLLLLHYASLLSEHVRSLHHLAPAAGGGWTAGTILSAIPKIVGFAEDQEVSKRS